MKRTALAIILAAFAPLAFGQADETGAQPVRTPDRSTTCTLDSLNDTCSVALEGRGGAAVTITTSNLSATVIPEYSFDGGTTWSSTGYGQSAFFTDTDWISSSSIVFAGGVDQQQRIFVSVAGITHARVRVSAYASGTSSAKVVATALPAAMTVAQISQANFAGWFMQGQTSDGTAVAGYPVRIAGKNGSTAQDILTDAAGNLTAKVTDGTDTALVTAAGEQNVLATAQPGVDIGDVTVNNASGGSAVNIQDGGNSITVDGTVAVSGTVTTDGIVKDGTGDTTQANVSSGRLHVDAAVTDVTSGSCTLDSLNDTCSVALEGRRGIGALISTSNLSATVLGEGSYDGGTTWVNAFNLVDSSTWGLFSGVFSGGTATKHIEFVGSGGMSHVRLRVSAYTSGTATATLRVTERDQFLFVMPANPGIVGSFAVNDNASSLTVDAVDLDIHNLTAANDTVQIGDGSETATVRDTGTSDSLNVAIVDGSGNQVTSFGGGTQYVEDDAAAANPTGTAPMLVRDDTPNTQVTTDGDNVAQRGTNYGAAYVQVVSSAGAFIDSFGGSGGTAQADRSAFTDGTTTATPIAGVLNETATDPTEDQAAAVRITTERALHVNLRDATGAEVSAGGGTQYDEDTAAVAAEKLTMAGVVRDDTPASLVDADGDRTELQVDGTGRLWVNGSGVTQPVSGTVTATATDLDIRNLNATDDIVQARGAAADGAAVTGNPVLIAGQDGTNAQSIKTDTTGSVQVDIESSATIAVDTTSADQITPLGAAADGAAVSGNPLRIAGKDGSGNTQDIITDTAGELQVDVLSLPSVTIGTFPDNEPVNAAQRGGVAVVAGACERESLLYIQINQTTGTQLITGTSSERIYICSIQLMTATAQNIALVDGTGSVCATSPTGLLGGSTAATGWNFAANGGIVLPPTRDSYTKTSTDADNVCLLQSGAGQVSGSLTYISIPNI